MMACNQELPSPRGLDLLSKNSHSNLTPTIFYPSDHNIDLQSFSTHALSVVRTLKKAGYEAYIVGGCIRDLLLKTEPKDFDISTSAKPEEVKTLFKNCILVGKRFRLAHIRFPNQIIEVATFRSGSNEEDSLITKDNLWGSAEEDVLRRDFTINGLFYDPSAEIIIDYTGGVEDLKNRYLRTIGDPFLRFKQDPVRMLRLLKILSRYAFTVDPKTLEALQESCHELVKSSQPRVFEEIIKVLSSGESTIFFQLASEHRVLEILFPYMAKAFSLSKTLQDQTFACLTALDTKIQKRSFCSERHFLLAILLFPIVNFNVRYKYSQYPTMTIQSTFDYIRNFLTEFFADSFTSCSKKNFILTTLLLQMQYRLTPLNAMKKEKKSFFNRRLLRHAYFREALYLLEIRSKVYPKVEATYGEWLKHYELASE
ncbi:polynucleotide adenylyltransferase PcnB [Chlamydia trachomatis]|uniref:polynucleotide adenylyltransferase PcnB n=1 Tax=Chlamydia trachomatis TaxID=813 RepID=UPI00038DC303|nr:polynucleotide adenylyltransferase PcnB [Chlamydia trachomatis]AGT72712.1 poly(A) polymerase [Chlamydia trachomatis]